METIDILYALKKKYDKSFSFFIKDNRYTNYTHSGICSCLAYYSNELYHQDGKGILFEDRVKTLGFLYECYLERGGRMNSSNYWFPQGELKGRRSLINYAIKKLKK